MRHRCCPKPNQEEIDRRNCRHGHHDQRLGIITLLYNRLFVYGLVLFCTNMLFSMIQIYSRHPSQERYFCGEQGALASRHQAEQWYLQLNATTSLNPPAPHASHSSDRMRPSWSSTELPSSVSTIQRGSPSSIPSLSSRAYNGVGWMVS